MALPHKNLGDILVEEGVLTKVEFGEVMEKSKARNLSLEETLFKLGYISRDRLVSLLAKLHGTEYIDLHSCRPSSEAHAAVPAELALKLGALPYALAGDTLSVAVAVPFEGRSLEDIVTELERASGKKVHIAFCNPDPLKEMLMKTYKREAQPAQPARGDLSSIFKSIKSDEAGAGLRGQFEELYDVGQTALIGARSHPFGRAVASAIEEARAKLVDSKKYSDSGFDEEAAQLATQAVALLKEATAKADAVEKDWDKLVQQVKNLRAKVSALEEDGAAEYAASDFKELAEIRDALLECVNERNVDRLRSLLDQGVILSEKVSLLSPDKDRGREQVIASLAQVREVIARARKVGAKEHAAEVLKEAYTFLDRAESAARRSRWDEVRECLSSAESKALEAEGIAIRATERQKQLTLALREAVRAATVALEGAMAHVFAQEVIEDLMRAKDSINEAKACFDTPQLERGIKLAENVHRNVQEEIIPRLNMAERSWTEMFQRAQRASSQIRSVDIPLALKVVPEKLESLFLNQGNMVTSLCERNQGKLADAVSTCEKLLREIADTIAPVKESLEDAEAGHAVAHVLLASAAVSGIDENVAPAYEEARRLAEEAREFIEQGNPVAALDSAERAQRKLQAEVIEIQKAGRDKWAEAAPRAAELFKKMGTYTPDAMHYCPNVVPEMYSHASEMLAAFAARDVAKAQDSMAMLEEIIRSSDAAIEAAKSSRHKIFSEQLAEVEEAVHKAVERCSGYYAPDMLEDAYLELSRIREQIAPGPKALTPALDGSLARDLAVARTRVWQVEFLRERFEREREETLNQLHLKMDFARKEIDTCARRDFIGEDSPLLRKARALLEQADNSLIEGDIEESFELVRQSRALAGQLMDEAKESERQWKQLATSLTDERAPHRVILSDSIAQTGAPKEYGKLLELAEKTQSIVDIKNLEALNAHAERLSQTSEAIGKRIEASKEDARAKVSQKIEDVRTEMRISELMRADEFCPDVINAAHAYLDIARNYMETGDFARAGSAADDALAKARDASTLAKSSSERAGLLALDYMKIASIHVAQQQPEAAKQALERGLTLAELARVSIERKAER